MIVFEEGTHVHVEGNGEGFVQYREPGMAGKQDKYTIKCDGHTVTTTADKLTPVGPYETETEIHEYGIAELGYGAALPGRTTIGPIKEDRNRPGPAPDLMGAAQRHTGVVRMSATPVKGDIVCTCLHPLQNVRDAHDLAKVVDVRPGNLEPYVLQDEKTGAFLYANNKQFTKTVRSLHSSSGPRCALEADHRVKQGDIAPAFAVGETAVKAAAEMEQLKTKAEHYYWGFSVGQDVAVRGWGAGKIFAFHTDRKVNPIEVELSNGKRIFTDLQYLTKIDYARVPIPLQDEVRELEQKIKLLQNTVKSHERRMDQVLEILGVHETKLGGPWLKDDNSTLNERLSLLETKIERLVAALSGDGK